METLVIKIKIKMLLFSAMLKKISYLHTTYYTYLILVKLSFTVPNKMNTKINFFEKGYEMFYLFFELKSVFQHHNQEQFERHQ